MMYVWEVRSNKIQEKEEEERVVRKREILYLPFDEKQREQIGICDERKMWKHSDNRNDPSSIPINLVLVL
ncbi:hypothetical protein JOQ06_020586 [Pogonophryne albipinna]|uniref:Uncharacterized protein n=1 Tax=Pogonophryne albipinna TaxID=1090488 RepID=A0AAD6FWF5_9TELE|nr:hypothetical protein JOQ06_020586 [Pogonophryne albipinna]